MKYIYFLDWIIMITKSYLLLRIPWKPEEFKVTMCVAVVIASGIAHCLHSTGNKMKKKLSSQM